MHASSGSASFNAGRPLQHLAQRAVGVSGRTQSALAGSVVAHEHLMIEALAAGSLQDGSGSPDVAVV
jgi:hypothetical protein